MHILVLSEGDAEIWDSWSGITKSVVDHLRGAGHTVSTGDVELYGPQRWRTLATVFSPSLPRWRARFRLDAPAFAQRSRVAHRHIMAHPDADLILQVGATFESRGRAGKPYVLYCDSNVKMAERGMKSGFTQAVPLTPAERKAVVERERKIYEGATLIFTICEQLRRSFIDDFGIPAERVHTIHAGPNFDTSRIPPRSAQPEDKPPTVLFVGRQFARKGGDVLVKAFQTVRRTLPKAELLIIGPSAIDVNEPGLRLLGFVDKNTPEGWATLVSAYQSADVFCLPTRFEPFGIVFLEAMYFGLPCVGTDAWAVPEMVTHGETGFTVPVDDADALAERLLQLLTDQQLARTMGSAGRARATSYFSWPAVVQRMLHALDSVRLLPTSV